MSGDRHDSSGWGPSTRAVHVGDPAAVPGQPVVNPIFQTSTFHSARGGAGEVLYTRYGNNPNHRRLEERIRTLEGADACLVTASGISAMVVALLGCLKAGDHVLAASALYGGTQTLLDRELPRLGIETSHADFSADGWEAELRPNTRVVLLETLSNPLLRFTDPARVAGAAHRAGAAVVVDSTFTPPTVFRPLERGADLVVHSATKYLGGHSDVTAGVVCGGAERMASVAERARTFGAALDPHAAWLLERGVKTLPLRMERHHRNGLEVAEWCSEQPEIARVHYPGLPSHPDHAAAAPLLAGFGGMMSIELRGGAEAADRFV
ncbi:MAG TPA: PLP-dependent aspartate aminotransferase family protein, partial [Longimicrobiaceae bacterium]|nr:PLP-dependent aspartate aminotransferase family protein [Longimicrobiaceae bacterium]